MLDYQPALEMLLLKEGGYGGPPELEQPTNHGITQADYDTYRSAKGLSTQDVRNISDDETSDYYHRWWVDGPFVNLQDQRLAVYMFQLSFVDGLRTSIEILQKALGVTPDGNFGSESSQALTHALVNQHDEFWESLYREAVEHFIKIALANPAKLRYVVGWITERAFA